MKIYSIWAEHKEKFEVDSWTVVGHEWKKTGVELKEFRFIGGSNQSEDDALQNALKKRDAIKFRLSGNYDYSDEEYEADIVEEIIAKVNDRNIITRNRYGALVLNSEDVVFIDIDDHWFRWRYRWSASLLTRLKDRFQKRDWNEKMMVHIERNIKQYFIKEGYTRVYRTPKGYRILYVARNSEAPRASSSESVKIMQSFYADSTYANLCKKQNCYRARLTPKPWRIGIKRLKIIFPFRDQKQDEIQNNWLEQYNSKSEGFASCQFIEDHGKFLQNEVIEYHDRLCKARSRLEMA